MPLLNINVNGNPSRRASVFFRYGGVVLTDVFGGGTNKWWSIKDKALLKEINDLRANSSQADVLNNPIWQRIAASDPAKVAEVFVASGSKGGQPTFSGGLNNQVRASRSNGAGEAVHADPEPPQVDKHDVVRRWFRFFSEFGGFKPQPRIINTIFHLPTLADMKAYITGYFELSNNSYATDIAAKIDSREFADLAADTLMYKTNKPLINRRFEVYYGEPGGGKTTLAIVNNPDAEVVVCHASMTPDELFRGFDFENGKPVFKGCPLRTAMEQGKVVILDEINLLSEDCRRALQAITDGKTKVMINTEEITIAEGFKVVGTMNLNVGDMVFPLPPALVDRAAVIRKLEMDPDTVADIAI